MGGKAMPSNFAASSYPKLAAGPVGKKIHNLYTDRLRQFTDRGQYKSSSLWAKMYDGSASGDPHVKLSVYSPPEQTRPTFEDATSNDFKPTRTGNDFGPSWTTHWFKVKLTVPSELLDQERLEFHWDSNSEALVWSEDGEPLQGLTGGGERIEWILPDRFRDGKEHTFFVEMACNGMFGNPMGGDTIQPPDENRYFRLSKAEVVAVNLEARGLYIDFWIIGDAAREFPEDSWEEHEALSVGNEIMDCFIAENGSKECITRCRKIASRYIGDKVNSAAVYADPPNALVSGIGHCHIDTCWLWPWAETKRKVARSWASQCNLIEQFPEHRFCCSQAQQYKWLEMYYPSLYDRVKTKIKEGTFQPIGGSWVEHDTNMPSGESLVRQFVYGQRYFQSHFGERCKTFWLPDTFGYSSQIPQLCRLAGMTRFFTQKLSWNNINKFPHTTFNWVALDGSQVMCHMAPCETYTADANFGDVKRSVTQHKSMDQDATSLLVFGKGDGGGGPTWEHLEKLRRCRGMSDTVGLLPRVKMGDSVDDFFARLERKAEAGTKFTTWYGELYFEFHRGTYTTQANNKRNNRKAEIMLHDIELLATLASLRKGGYRYPKKDLDDMWEAVLLCQFHDCLPGSSIEMCYDDSNELYAKVFKTGEKLLSDVLGELGFQDASSSGALVAINTLPFARSELISLAGVPNSPSYGFVNMTSALTKVQHLEVSSSSPRSLSIKETAPDTFTLTNTFFTVTVTKGHITSLYDRTARREAIPPGAKANQYVLYDDKPLYWQAWDVEVFHLGSRTELNNRYSTIFEDNEYRVALLTHTQISPQSWIKTIVSLSSAHSSPFVSIASEIEWREDKKFLKVEFPVDVRATDASYETQFGIVRRPTHYNTSWDMAKFEVCCHRWADLSESNFGVSIINDSKYGFATQGNVMRLSVLRAPKAPDAHADMGRHHVGWAIMPHAGPLDHRTVRAAAAFNNPLQGGPQFMAAAATADADAPADVQHTVFPFQTQASPYVRRHPAPETVAGLLGSIRLSADSDAAIVLDTVKRGEDDADVVADVLARGGVGSAVIPGAADATAKSKRKTVVLRLYDALGGRCRGRVVLGGPGAGWRVERVRRCNLLEDDEGEVGVERVEGEQGGEEGFRVELRAFEVASFKVEVVEV